MKVSWNDEQMQQAKEQGKAIVCVVVDERMLAGGTWMASTMVLAPEDVRRLEALLNDFRRKHGRAAKTGARVGASRPEAEPFWLADSELQRLLQRLDRDVSLEQIRGWSHGERVEAYSWASSLLLRNSVTIPPMPDHVAVLPGGGF